MKKDNLAKKTLYYFTLLLLVLAADLFQLLEEVISSLAKRFDNKGEKFIFYCIFFLGATFALAEVAIAFWNSATAGHRDTYLMVGGVNFMLFYLLFAWSHIGLAMSLFKILFYSMLIAIAEMIILFLCRQVAGGALMYLYVWILNFIMALLPYAIVIGTSLVAISDEDC